MRKLISFLVIVISAFSFAQQEFHVFPVNGNSIKGTPQGDGTLKNPWDLQTALSQTSERVNGGDIIWLHKGTYKGRFKSLLQSTIKNKYVTVSAFKNDKVILNGNVEEKGNYVLQVNGSNVIYKNFEITYLGNFSRIKTDQNFRVATGINHIKGEDCKFLNLVIHNIPGSGFGSWKATGGTVIEDCVIYNNGYLDARGHGVGIYIQNQSEKTRLINNNIIFNNYYKGIEVWSASSGSNFEFVKNITLSNNSIFNNGSPSGKYVDNLIVASNDSKGVNVAKYIKVVDNVFYHNVDFANKKNYGYGSSLTLGYTSNSPVEDVTISNNTIIGKNNAFSLSHIKSGTIENNVIYAGYIHLNTSVLKGFKANSIKLNKNTYYTRKLSGFRFNKHRDYTIKDWQKEFKTDRDSELKLLSSFEINPVLKVQKLNTNSNQFNITLLEKDGNDVEVDFANFNIKEGMNYRIYDIENRAVVIKLGKVASNLKIEFPMSKTQLEMPLHNTTATKTANNFGVYRIEFSPAEKRKSFFGRFFDWLF